MPIVIAPIALAAALMSPGGLFGDGPDRHDAHQPAPGPAWYYQQFEPPPPPHHHHGGGCALCRPGGRIVTPGPGAGWGFPNGNPDGYGYVDYGSALPLGADRTPDYFFRRYYATTPTSMFFPTYYNPYLMRGQRYIPYAGCGGAHPFGGAPSGSSVEPPYPNGGHAMGVAPPPSGVQAPVFDGRTEGGPLPVGDPPEERGTPDEMPALLP